jgi:hypothetical protein
VPVRKESVTVASQAGRYLRLRKASYMLVVSQIKELYLVLTIIFAETLKSLHEILCLRPSGFRRSNTALL